MNEILAIIDGLQEDQRRDLIIILCLKYQDDFKKANKYFHWPNSIENASEFVKNHIKTWKENT